MSRREQGQGSLRDTQTSPPIQPPQDVPSGVGVAREHEVADDATSLGKVSSPSIGAWSAVLAPMSLQAGLQLPYILKWIDLESGGNPCDVGDPRQHGPDGNPREMGIAQFYNPDDLIRLKVSGASLRAYCVPGDQHEVVYKGRVVRGFSKALLRPISPAEMAEQARMTIGLIAQCARDADRDLAAVHVGPTWGHTKRDFWTLVKLRHGLPGISSSGLGAVTKKLGRPPASWREFRTALQGVTLDHNTEQYRSEFERILSNAERCASMFSELAVS